MMNILITGKPHSGKSTMLKNIVGEVDNKRGFYTEEMLEDGVRTGFKMVANNGSTYLLASTKISGAYRVSKYQVDLKGLQLMIPRLKNTRPGELLYIDEIGQMQLYCKDFEDLVKMYIDNENPFVGTLTQAYEHPFIAELRERKDLEIIVIDENNRDATLRKLKEKIENI